MKEELPSGWEMRSWVWESPSMDSRITYYYATKRIHVRQSSDDDTLIGNIEMGTTNCDSEASAIEMAWRVEEYEG